MPPQPTNAGIVVDESSGERKIPESVRPDGSTRKAIKIRPGYRPPEDVEVYKNRTAETFRSRGKGPVPGAEGLKDDTSEQSAASSAAANKNAKRREARKKAKAVGEGQAGDDGKAAAAPPAAAAEEELDPEAEREKKARNLKKKLRQAKDLKDKKDIGESLLPEQIAKVIKINELIRELDALGFDAEGEPKTSGTAADEKKTADSKGSSS